MNRRYAHGPTNVRAQSTSSRSRAGSEVASAAGNSKRACTWGHPEGVEHLERGAVMTDRREVHPVGVPEATIAGLTDAPVVDEHGITGVDDFADQLVEDRDASAQHRERSGRRGPVSEQHHRRSDIVGSAHRGVDASDQRVEVDTGTQDVVACALERE